MALCALFPGFRDLRLQCRMVEVLISSSITLNPKALFTASDEAGLGVLLCRYPQLPWGLPR